MQELLTVLPAWATKTVTEIIWILLGFGLAGIFFWYRRRKEKREFQAGELRGEVIASVLIFDEQADGSVLLKPRVVISPKSIASVFVTQLLQNEVSASLAWCDTSPPGSFIILKDPQLHEVFMENVRALVSSLGASGHLARAEGNPFKEEIYYVMATFSLEGKHRKIRIDLLHEDTISRFSDPNFIKKIADRPAVGAHHDLAAVCEYAADKRMQATQAEADIYSLRVSLSHRVF